MREELLRMISSVGLAGKGVFQCFSLESGRLGHRLAVLLHESIYSHVNLGYFLLL